MTDRLSTSDTWRCLLLTETTMTTPRTRRRFLRMAGISAAGVALPAAAGGRGGPAEERTGTIDVRGARLRYAVRGEGPLLVIVPGRKGSGDGYQNLAEALSSRYQVVTYDRRGFSRSRLVGAQDYAHRLDTDADDVGFLIEHLADQPATVFGNSSGALVSLQLLVGHPNVVRTVVAHEPPAMRLLPDGARWIAFFGSVYDTYRRSGIDPALQRFSEGTGIIGGVPPTDNPCSHDAANDTYWFERELRQYPAVELDVKALAAHADRLILAGGRESRKQPSYRPNTVLAAKLGQTVVNLPGDHLGMLKQPIEFARELLNHI